MNRKRYRTFARSAIATFSFFLALSAAQDAAAQKTVLFIYDAQENDNEAKAAGAIDNEDSQLIDLLENELGYTVELRDVDNDPNNENAVNLSDTTDVDVIFISESVPSGQAVSNFVNRFTGGDQYANINIPIVTPEVYIYDEMHWRKMGPTYNDDHSQGFSNTDRINILDVDHPILGGLRQGPVAVYGTPPAGEPISQMAFGVPYASADVIATIPGSTLMNSGRVLAPWPEARGTIFAYEVGDAYGPDSLNLVAKSRRVGFFAHRNGSENLSDVGQKLFMNAIAWAAGDEAKLVEIEADAPRILFVYDAEENDNELKEGGAIDNEDAELITILEDLGYELDIRDVNNDPNDPNAVNASDTTGVDVIFISESVPSGQAVSNFVNRFTGDEQYGNINIPIVTPEVYIYDDMLWQKPGIDGTGFGFINTDAVTVENTTHAIMHGVTDSNGAILVYAAPPAGERNQIAYSVPHPAAEILTGVPSWAVTDSGEPVASYPELRGSTFVYERGDTLISADSLTLVAKHRRVATYIHRNGSENLSEQGRNLFINSILWAAGRESEARMITTFSTAAEGEGGRPAALAIRSVYPNPFRANVHLSLAVKQAGQYEVRIYDLLGRLVAKRDAGALASGVNTVSVDLSEQASGVYLVRVTNLATGESATSRAVRVK